MSAAGYSKKQSVLGALPLDLHEIPIGIQQLLGL